jgi:hypothetical protein
MMLCQFCNNVSHVFKIQPSVKQRPAPSPASALKTL